MYLIQGTGINKTIYLLSNLFAIFMLFINRTAITMSIKINPKFMFF